MEENKKGKSLIIIALTILVCSVGFSFAYFTTYISRASQVAVTVDVTERPVVTYIKSDPIEIVAGIDNFYEDAGNISDKTYQSIKLVTPGEFTEVYTVYLNLNINEYIYTTEEDYAEIIITVYDEESEIVTEAEGLEFVTIKGISGFDVTEKLGQFTVSSGNELTTSDELTHTWAAEIHFVNLDSDQTQNSGKTLKAEIEIDS